MSCIPILNETLQYDLGKMLQMTFNAHIFFKISQPSLGIAVHRGVKYGPGVFG